MCGFGCSNGCITPFNLLHERYCFNKQVLIFVNKSNVVSF